MHSNCILDSVANLLVRHMVFVGNVQKSPISQQSIARKNSSDGKIEYIMASMLIVLLDVW